MKENKYYLIISDNYNSNTADITELKAKTYRKALDEAEDLLISKFENFQFKKTESGEFKIVKDPSKAEILQKEFYLEAHIVHCKYVFPKADIISTWKDRRQEVLREILENTERDELERLKNKYDLNKGIQNKDELFEWLIKVVWSDDFVKSLGLFNFNNDEIKELYYSHSYKEKQWLFIEHIEQFLLKNYKHEKCFTIRAKLHNKDGSFSEKAFFIDFDT